jgi:hypothetical protein
MNSYQVIDDLSLVESGRNRDLKNIRHGPTFQWHLIQERWGFISLCLGSFHHPMLITPPRMQTTGKGSGPTVLSAQDNR